MGCGSRPRRQRRPRRGPERARVCRARAWRRRRGHGRHGATGQGRRTAARLVYGTADARDLLNNQFDYEPANQSVDPDVRVLQARNARGKAIATLVNFSTHTTVLGSSNTKASGDWVQRLNPMVEKLTGAPAVTVVGMLGRTQPADRGCADEALEDDAESLCALDAYAGRIAERVTAALAAARPIGGDPAVAARSYLVQDAGTNPFLLGLVYAGDARLQLPSTAPSPRPGKPAT